MVAAAHACAAFPAAEQEEKNRAISSYYSVCRCAGLAFFDLSDGPEAVEKRLALLFFILLLFELLPFCYMSFYVADRRFFAADVSNDLYHPSAYYIAAVIAGARCSCVILVLLACACLRHALYRGRHRGYARCGLFWQAARSLFACACLGMCWRVMLHCQHAYAVWRMQPQRCGRQCPLCSP